MKIQVANIGKMAQEILAQHRSWTVSGVTRRGVFLSAPSQKVIFLSGEPYRGPLTLNLLSNPPQLQRLTPGASVLARPGSLQPYGHEWSVEYSQASVWEPPPLPAPILSLPERHVRLLSALHQVLSKDAQPGQNSLLRAALDLLDPPAGLPSQAPGGSDPERLWISIQALQPVPIARQLEPFYGLGAGLTPSGDDLILGLLLALNRWGAVIHPGFDLQALNQLVIPRAYAATTTLSANLIECAARGAADERLIGALDGLISPAPDLQTRLTNLLSWGASSGSDALAGMALVL